MRRLIIILAAVVALTGCAGSSRDSLSPGTHALQSTDAGTWRAPGSKTCQWILSYKTRHNGPVKKKSGHGYSPVVTIGALGVRLTSDNCGTFKKDA